MRNRRLRALKLGFDLRKPLFESGALRILWLRLQRHRRGHSTAMCIQGKCVLRDDAQASLVRLDDSDRKPVAPAGTRTATLPTAQKRKERKRNTTRR